ncbi:MAG: TlpA family protein disulfide reductase [Sphingobacterium sp.]
MNKITDQTQGIFTSFAALLLAFMVGCNSQENNQGTAQTDSAVKDQIGEEPVVADVQRGDAENIVFKDEQGETLPLESLKGKVVFINFWATWCPPCIEEMPSIDQLYRSYKNRDDVVFITVDVDNKIEESTAFMKDNGYELPVYTPASNIPSEYLAGAIPTTVILARSGEMMGRLEGGRDYSAEEFVDAFDELINDDQ